MSKDLQQTSVSAEEQKEILDRNSRIGQRYAILGIAGNLVLTIFKFIAGFIGQSSAMIADATHSASDIFDSVVCFISVRISGKPKDEGHPYGHGGAETISTMICAAVLFAAGFSILFNGGRMIYEHLFRGAELEAPGVIAFIAAVVSIVTKECMYRVTYKAGKKINSPALIANAMDHRSDVFSSIGTVIGIGGALIGFPVLDPAGGVVVSFFIMHMAWTIAKSGINQIMSASCGEEVITDVRNAAEEIDGVLAAEDIRAIEKGSFIIASLTIKVNRLLSVEEGHNIAARVKANILRKVAHTYDVVVHIEPME